MFGYKQMHFLCIWGNGGFLAWKDIARTKKPRPCLSESQEADIDFG